MPEFSALYRKMCDKAKPLKEVWKPRELDWYCEKGDYRDGPAELLYDKEVPKTPEKIKSFKSKYVWLPYAAQIIERILGEGIPKLQGSAQSRYGKWIEENKDEVEDIENRFKDKVDDINNVKALIFYMQEEHGQVWNYTKEEWIEKREVAR